MQHRQRKQIPTKAPYSELEPTNIQEKIKEITNHPRITVKTGMEIARISGAPGMFDVSFKQTGTKTKWDVPPPKKKEGEETAEEPVEVAADLIKCEDILTSDPDAERFGVIVVAAGGRPSDPSEFEHLGYGKYANVITNVMMEDAAFKGKIIRPSDGKEAKTVAFIQSPGLNGDDSDFPYCSSVTSMISLKQAKYVREDYNDGKALFSINICAPRESLRIFTKACRVTKGYSSQEVKSRALPRMLTRALQLQWIIP